ncbi:hypothetical protein [Superficieibacter sp.]|uniref:hypothetical protein n=1 Tax=Superficieibacter sp. TaxID=2303322 RepID=UPI0028A5CE9D|nr:hypothetical protein [Superficieibacter sp.]
MNTRFASLIRWIFSASLCLCAFSSWASVTLTSADEQQINALIDRWNDDLNRQEQAQPQSLYAPQVEWFGQTLTAQQVLANQQVFLAKNKNYQQSIVSTLNIQPAEEDRVQVRFVKRAGLDLDKEQNYPAEFMLKKETSGWRIVSETDGITRAVQSKDDSSLVAKGKFDGSHTSYVWMTDSDPRTGGVCTEEGDCECALWSSVPDVLPVKIPQCLAGGVETVSGLDDSGRDRVLLFPQWWSSALRVLYLYDIQQKQWIKTLPGISFNINLQETATGADLVKRDPAHPGRVNVVQSVFDEAKEEPTTKVVSQTLRTLK